MDIEQSDHGNAVVLMPSGRLNMVSAPHLKKRVDEVIANRRARIIVDLSAVTFMDSSGVRALIGGLKRARQAAGDLRIAGATDRVQDVLRLTNLDRILRPYLTVNDALGDW